MRDLPTINQVPPAALQHEAEPLRRIPLPPRLKPASEPDLALQQTAPLAPATQAPTAGLGFDGLGNASLGFTVHSAPPDTNGAVGSTQYVQWANSSFAVFNKSTGALIAGPTAGNSLWSGFGGGCQTNNDEGTLPASAVPEPIHNHRDQERETGYFYGFFLSDVEWLPAPIRLLEK